MTVLLISSLSTTGLGGSQNKTNRHEYKKEMCREVWAIDNKNIREGEGKSGQHAL